MSEREQATAGADQIMVQLPRVVFVTGTDTGVGKTIVCAAFAAVLTAAGRTVAVYKPAQAGLDDGHGDIDHVRRLSGIDHVYEGIRLRYPMAPVAAARRAGITLPDATAHVTTIKRLAASHDYTLVEGAGGVLVQLDHDGYTLPDIAAACGLSDSATAGAVVVCRASLGTLNHTELTIEALNRRRIKVVGLVIGSWPNEPTEIQLSNLDYLRAHPVPLLGSVPEEVGLSPTQAFRKAASDWFQITV